MYLPWVVHRDTKLLKGICSYSHVASVWPVCSLRHTLNRSDVDHIWVTAVMTRSLYTREQPSILFDGLGLGLQMSTLKTQWPPDGNLLDYGIDFQGTYYVKHVLSNQFSTDDNFRLTRPSLPPCRTTTWSVSNIFSVSVSIREWCLKRIMPLTRYLAFNQGEKCSSYGGTAESLLFCRADRII